MSFPILSNIEAIAQNSKLMLIEVKSTPVSDIILDDTKGNAVEEFCAIAVNNGVKTIFICIENLEGEQLEENLIDEANLIPENYGQPSREILAKARRHNEEVRKLASSGPFEITLFFPLNGIICSLCFTQDWFFAIPDPNETLEAISEGYEEEIRKVREERQVLEQQQEEEFIELLINDDEFQRFTATGRKYHAARTWERTYKKFKSLIDINILAREAYSRIQHRQGALVQRENERVANALASDPIFKKCKNKTARRAYIVALLSKQTGRHYTSRETDQIIELALLKCE